MLLGIYTVKGIQMKTKKKLCDIKGNIDIHFVSPYKKTEYYLFVCVLSVSLDIF